MNQNEEGRQLHDLNMDVEVPGHDLKRRMIEFVKLLDNGETFKMTFRSGGQVRDAWMFFADGHWQLEVIQYDEHANPLPAKHGRP